MESHPFTGENIDANVVHREDGSGFSMRVKHQQGNYNKYEKFIERKSRLNGRDQASSVTDMLWEMLFTDGEE